jgi:ferric iron reductase protein FhuF
VARDLQQITDFADLLTAEASKKYPYCRGYFLLRPPQGSEVVACRELLSTHVLDGLIDRYATTFPGADRRAVVSMWTMYYFSILMIGTAIAALEARRVLPVALDRAGICIKPGSGEPHAFLLPDFGAATGAEGTHQALDAVVRMHAEPLVEAIAKGAGVSRKLLWTNISGYLFWIVDEVSRLSGAGQAAGWPELVRAKAWPDGWANPLHDLVRPAEDENGAPVARRRVCCLRYALPGVTGCGAICPLPAGRHPI